MNGIKFGLKMRVISFITVISRTIHRPKKIVTVTGLLVAINFHIFIACKVASGDHHATSLNKPKKQTNKQSPHEWSNLRSDTPGNNEQLA